MCEMYTWRNTKHIVRDKPIFSSERMLHKDYYRRSSAEKKKKNVVVGIKGLEAKTNWLAVNRES
jgi:hypothetical protein